MTVLEVLRLEYRDAWMQPMHDVEVGFALLNKIIEAAKQEGREEERQERKEDTASRE